MKKNQPNPEPEVDAVEPARLASFGVLVGLLIIGGFVLVLTLSSSGRPPAGSEGKSDPRPAIEVREDPNAAAQQHAAALPTVDPVKPAAGKPDNSKKRGPSSPSKAVKPAKPYEISVTPGRTPRMTQVQ